MSKFWCLPTLLLCLNFFTAKSQCTVVGWASQNGGVTGGGTATATTVTNYTDLKAAITSTTVKVVYISGAITIPAAGRINFQDQTGKTVYGLPGSKLISNDLTKDGSGIFYVKRCTNVIFKNLTFVGPGAFDVDGQDNMTVDNCTNIWVDHCEFQDGMDGNLDIKTASDFITITWCKFIYNKAPIAGGSGGSDDHRFTNLFGSSDGATGDRTHLNITLQNNWWAQGCKERMPRVRFGKVHIVNNYYSSTVANKCVAAGFEANLLVESNVFENVNDPISLMDNNFTAITSRNNTFTNTTGNTAGSGTAFTPPYSLTVTPVGNVKNLVTAGAGATLTSPNCSSAGSFALTTTASPAAGGTISGAGTYTSGTVVTITASPASGYTFTGWSGAASGTSATTTVTMNSAKSVTANFQAQGTGGTSTIRIEDTGVCAYDGTISSNTGAANGQVINLSNSAGKNIDWKVSVPFAGTYVLNWRYVNSSSSNTFTMGLIINGTTVTQSFPKTSSSTVFANTTATVSLAAGVNTIRLQSVAAGATADIDWLEITGNAPTAASCATAKAVHENIYPNPTKGMTTVTVSMGKNEQAVIRLYNALGSMVDNLGVIKSVAGEAQRLNFNLDGKTPGLYYVVVTGDKGFRSTFKLLVQ